MCLVLLILSVVAMWVRRIEYITYLRHEGYGLLDIAVPWNVWSTFQTTGRGLFLNSIVITSLAIIVLVVAIRMKKK